MKRPSTLKPLPLIHQLGFLAFSNKPKRAAADFGCPHLWQGYCPAPYYP
nr:MAG TPA: hypothetical protein [Bacteriophage sp.]